RLQLSQINPTQPVARNLQFKPYLPPALDQLVVPIGRRGLNGSCQRADAAHVPSARAAVVTHAKNVRAIPGSGGGAHVDPQGFPRSNTRMRAEPLDGSAP